jgi:hypothetical protein
LKNKAKCRPLAGNPKHEALNPKRAEQNSAKQSQSVKVELFLRHAGQAFWGLIMRNKANLLGPRAAAHA